MFNTHEERCAALDELVEKYLCNVMDDEGISNLYYTNLLTSPASTKYHGAYRGGLFDHSYNVVNNLLTLTKNNDLIWRRPESPVIVGLFHDLCKLDCYTEKTVDGATVYEYNQNTLFSGHGDKSVIIASSWLKLTGEEAACIRYHMGAFTDKEEWKYYTNAIHIYPNVLWTHIADMMAAHIDEI